MQSSFKLVVPTKNYDGGSSSSYSDFAMKRKQYREDSFDSHQLLDAFSYYSSLDNRMRVLLSDQPAASSRRSPFSTDMEQDTVTCSHRRSVPSSSGVDRDSDKNARRTRVSFELHPTLLIEDVLISNGMEE
jgi:hypothetical protein